MADKPEYKLGQRQNKTLGSNRSSYTSSYPPQQPPIRYTFPPSSPDTSAITHSAHAPHQLQLKRRSIAVNNDGSLSPVEENKGEKLFGRLDGIVGLDQVVRGAQFAIHSCITYPFTILKRQFQVFPYYNLSFRKSMPWHTLGIMKNITLSQGVYSWWRGWQAHSVYLIGRPVVGSIVSRIIEPLQNKRSSKRSLWIKKKIIHIVVDGLTYAVCMPLLSFILMQSVQADSAGKTYPSDYSGFKEFVTERSLVYPGPSNLLPYLNLLAPTLITSISNELILAGITPLITRFSSNYEFLPRQVLHKLLLKTVSSFIVDLLLYPLVTVSIRLHCQGLPILVSNMETGSGVQYVQAYYSGPVDCVNGIWAQEGVAGFYKGLSALLLQYAVEGLVLFLLWKGVAYLERFGHNQNTK